MDIYTLLPLPFLSLHLLHLLYLIHFASLRSFVQVLQKEILSLSSIDSGLLDAMGIRPCRGPVPIPLYARKTMVYDLVQPIPGMVVGRVADVPAEQQLLMSLVLQIEDGQAFRRYFRSYEKEKTDAQD